MDTVLPQKKFLQLTEEVKKMSALSLGVILKYESHHSKQKMSKLLFNVFQNLSKLVATAAGDERDRSQEIIVLSATSVARLQATNELQRRARRKIFL